MKYPIVHIVETSSTNTFLRDWSEQNPEVDQAVVCTNFQLAGKGQRGNSWESERGKNLIMSLLIHPDFIEADNQFIISQIVSLAVKETLSRYTDNITIKWPNDLYWKDKKICGILIENDLSENHICRTIIGIGININQKKFVSDAHNPVSLNQITGKEYNISEIRDNMANDILENLEHLKNNRDLEENIRQKYFESLFRREGIFPFRKDKTTFMAQIHDVETSGMLVLKNAETDKLERFAFKGISFVI